MSKDIIIGQGEQAVTQNEMVAALNGLMQVVLQPTEQGVIAQSKIGPVIVATIVIPRETFLQCAKQVALQEQSRIQLHRAAMDAIKTKI